MIKWQRGSYQKFFAKMKIRIGGKDNTVDKIEKGDEFEYDGSILKYAGAELSSTQLRGAIKNGWASLVQDDDTPVKAFVTTRNVAKATTVNRDLSRVQRAGVSMGTDSLDEETVLNVSDRGKIEKAVSGSSPKILTSDNNRRGMSVSSSEIDSQEGVTVGKVRSAARLGSVDVSANPKLASTIENRGLGRPVLNTGKVVMTEGVTIRTNVSDVDRSHVDSSEEGVVVGSVRHSKKASTEGIDVRDTSNIRSSRSIIEEVSKPRKAPAINTKISPKIRIAKAIDPTFPSDWVFSGKLADRIEAVKEHGATPVFLEALYAAEGDQMRKKLESEFPKQFK